MNAEEAIREESIQMQRTKEQLHRYFIAVYGEDYVFRAPETFPNLLEQWMLAVMNGSMDFANDKMIMIEDLAAERRSRVK